jgi:hypothetical protein
MEGKSRKEIVMFWFKMAQYLTFEIISDVSFGNISKISNLLNIMSSISSQLACSVLFVWGAKS